MELIKIVKLIDKPVNELFVDMPVISAVGTRGKISEINNTTKNENDFWIKIKWDNGKISSGPWLEKDRWARVTIAE